MNINLDFWKQKKILITGHTGFKGGWLTILLSSLNSKVSGYALNPEGKFNLFTEAKVKKNLIYDFRKNVASLKDLNRSIEKVRPEIIFHLAAQSSVIESFKNSKNTITSNVLGTANLLEALKKNKSVKCVIIITTDKVYQNYKTRQHFKESSLLGGDDVYSGSKACCEILINSYRKSFLEKKQCNIASVRAGNCFGGGDWTKDRIVKDALENFSQNKKLFIRSPDATRPWQHVMEPLIGYLLLAEKLCSKKGKDFAGAWNFGPSTKQNMKVLKLVKLIKERMKSSSKIIIRRNDKRLHNKKYKVFESKYLNIDSHKAHSQLRWKPRLTIKEAINLTVEWYDYFRSKKDLNRLTVEQLNNYLQSGKK